MKQRWHLWIAMGILLIGLIVGSINTLDLTINAAIFDPKNGFGLVASSFGMIPGYATLSVFGGALFALTFKNKKFHIAIRILFYAIILAFYGLSTYFLGKDVFSVNGFYNPKFHPWLGCIIMGIVMLPCLYFGYWLGKKNENPRMWIIILVLAFAMFMALVPGTTLLKAIMHRPRYRMVIFEQGTGWFRNWWEPFKEYSHFKDGENVIINGVTYGKEEFKSFPSGHSCAVMCGLILATTIPLMNKKWMKYQVLFFYIAFAWGLVVMFSRMLVGAHFLTDTCMGSLLAVIFFYIANEVVVRKLLPAEEKKEEPVQEVQTEEPSQE